MTCSGSNHEYLTQFNHKVFICFQSEEPVVMDTDTSSGDLVLVLETTNDATSPKVTAQNQGSSGNGDTKDKSAGATNPSEGQTAPSAVSKEESTGQNSVTTTPGSKTMSGSKGTPSGQPRRIQFVTLSKTS